MPPKKPQILSKSRLKRGLQCHKSLFFTLYRKELEPTVSAATQLNFDEGNEVGELARTEFPGGVLIDFQPWEREESAEATKAAIKGGANTIFEASFLADDLYARVDVLTRESKSSAWEVIEVKKSGKVKEEHLEDVAIQALVLEESDLKIKSYSVMHLNPKCVFPNLKNLFVIEDVTKDIKSVMPDLKKKVVALKKVAASTKEPKIDIGPHCDQPNSCAFRDHCWSDFPSPSVFDLPGVGPVKGWKLVNEGTTKIEDLDENDFKDKLKTAIQVTKTGKRWIETIGFKKAIKDWEWPLYFLDFETLAPAIPRYDGASPYTEVPFQFSCHVWESACRGTALKPASEHWILIQKPVSEHNIAANIKKYATGAINIDGTRTPVKGEKIPSASNLNFKGGDSALWDFSKRSENSSYSQHPKGRFPTNVVLTKDADLAKNLNAQSGRKSADVSTYFFNVEPELPFIYCKKPDSSERGGDNSHPTVKPINLMRHLARMITPAGGVLLDPFMGSGSTGVAALREGFQFSGIEMAEEYYQIANQRLKGVEDV